MSKADNGSEFDRDEVAVRSTSESSDFDPDFASLLDQMIPSDDAASRTQIGRFEVLSELGRGAFGTVLRVRDPNLNRECALKVPNPKTLTSANAMGRFLDDARAAAKIDHANVVRVFEADTVSGLAYIAMEYCPGRSLAAFLKETPRGTPLPARWMALLMAGIADGVQTIHDAGFLHRDLKPGNIMLVPEDPNAPPTPLPTFCPKVGDFGLVKHLADHPDRIDRTRTGAFMGTLPYVSREQARGDRLIDARSDVYALGVILYRLATGKLPYLGDGDAETLRLILDPAPPPSPRSWNPDLPRDLETICKTAMAKVPSDRYRSASAMADDLRRFASGEPIVGSPWWVHTRAWARRHQRTLAVVIACAMVAAGGAEVWRQSRARIWLQELEAANVQGLPALMNRGVPPMPWVSDELKGLYRGANPEKKLAAAVALSDLGIPYSVHAYQGLLACPPDEIAPLARALSGRIPDMVERLEHHARTPLDPSVVTTNPDTFHKARANAAAALVMLGYADSGFDLLKFDPEPDARTFLIHTLGPAGAPPSLLFRFIKDAKTEVSIRRALILSLGEVPDAYWNETERREVTGYMQNVYRDDPDSGVHGACKWLLTTWNRDADLARIDAALAKMPEPRPNFGWRITPSGLTMIRVDVPGDRIIEVSDTELRVDYMRRLDPSFVVPTRHNPEETCAVTALNYLIAAEICNKIGRLERIQEEDTCYRSGTELRFEPVANPRDRAGYRMMTTDEFLVSCQAGTTTARYFGDSDEFVSRYAWHAPDAGLRTHPVARLKPNDLGLFDTLGNAAELGQGAGPRFDPQNQAIVRGGSVLYRGPDLSVLQTSGPLVVNDQIITNRSHGLRVCRTPGR